MPGRKGIEDARREAREMRQRLEAEVQARRLAEAEQARDSRVSGATDLIKLVSLHASLNSERAKSEETMRKRIDQETQALSRIDKVLLAAHMLMRTRSVRTHAPTGADCRKTRDRHAEGAREAERHG